MYQAGLHGVVVRDLDRISSRQRQMVCGLGSIVAAMLAYLENHWKRNSRVDLRCRRMSSYRLSRERK